MNKSKLTNSKMGGHFSRKPLEIKGFTLIELLAVIVILAVIALITVPTVLNIIENTKEGAFKAGVYSLFDAYEYKEMDNKFSSIGELDISELSLSNDRYSIGKIKRNNSDNKKIEIVNVSDGSYCANGTLEELDIIKGDCSNLDETAPVINNISIEKTTSSMTVIVSFSEPDSFIDGYEFRLLDSSNNVVRDWESGDTLTGSGNNRVTTKTFNNLTQGSTYKVEVRITNTSDNENNIVIDNEETALNSFNTPEISYNTSDYEINKIVTLTYDMGVTTRYKIVNNDLDTIVAWTTLNNTSETITISNYDYTVIIESTDGTTTLSNSSVIGYLDLEAPTITLKDPGSATIREGDSNVILSTYFNYSQNGDASITSTSCIDTSNSNAVVTNTNSLIMGTHNITCIVTKSTGLNVNETKTIIVESAILPYSIGTAIYFNPQTNTSCTNPVSTPGTKTGCMKWYVIENSSQSSMTVKVLLDHNTTPNVYWNYAGNTINGMGEIASAFTSDTAGWASNLGAHVPSVQEIATAAGYGTFDVTRSDDPYFETKTDIRPNPYTGRYSWLYDWTYGCTNYGCTVADNTSYNAWYSYGYWTSSPEDNFSVWSIYYTGNFSAYNARTYILGIRPVITINKANL